MFQNRIDEIKGLNAGNFRPSWRGRFYALRTPYNRLILNGPKIIGNLLNEKQTRALLEQEVIVPDISFYQDNDETTQGVDFGKMKNANAKGVIVRGGQNLWIDEDFDFHWASAKDAGIPRGSYYFLDPRVKPADQADRWAEKLVKDMPELDLWADYEAPDVWGGTYKGYDGLYNFLERCRINFPTSKITIYTGYYYWLEHSPSTQSSLNYFKQYNLALAWYTTNPSLVKIPSPWTELLWWQWTSKGNGPMYGVESLNIDLNYFNGLGGTYQDYRAFFGLGTTTPPPDPGNGGEQMADYYEVRSSDPTEYRSIRGGPRITFPVLSSLPINGVAKARVDDVVNYTSDSYDGDILRARAGDQWVHVFEVNGAARDGWVAVRHLGVTYTVLTLISPPDAEYIIHVKDGVYRRFIEEK